MFNVGSSASTVQSTKNAGIQVLTAVLLRIQVFWDVMPYPK
jgi:hypothetical protein